MAEYFLRKTGTKKSQAVVFLFIFIVTLFIRISFVNAQNDSVKSSIQDSVITEETDSIETLHAEDNTTSTHDDTHALLGHATDDIKRGKRFFLGILPFEREHESCVSCHNIKAGDTLNWNPSAYDVAVKFASMDFASFQQAVMQPNGVKMAASHQNFDLSEEDLRTVKVYLDDLAVKGPPAQKPSINELLLFLFLGLIITWALLDLIFFHKVKYKFITIIILIGAFGYQVSMIYEEAVKLGRSQDYQPDQPIKFSHQVHATENQIDCMFCHHTVENSKTANIPSTNLCMNCHIVVREGTRSGTFEIDKLVKAYEEGRSVEWIRIHKLPDHVFFSHAQHVGVGKLDCAQCHGKIEDMHVVRQENDLSMGWCIDCHRQTKVNFVDNDYYTIFEEFHNDLKKGVMDSVVAADIGANECQKCHY